jgi:hypothetical protein
MRAIVRRARADGLQGIPVLRRQTVKCTISVNSDVCPYQTSDPNNPITFAVLGNLDDQGGDSARVGFGSIAVRHYADVTTIQWQLFDDFLTTDERWPRVGAFLVRPTSVPEPTTLSLSLGAGLLATFLCRRRTTRLATPSR